METERTFAPTESYLCSCIIGLEVDIKQKTEEIDRLTHRRDNFQIQLKDFKQQLLKYNEPSS